jgi:hypothetical protein
MLTRLRTLNWEETAEFFTHRGACMGLDPACVLALPSALYRDATPGYTGMGSRRALTVWEDTDMRWQHQWWSVLVAAVFVGLVGMTPVAAAGEQFLPILGVREGAQRSQQIPLGNGFIDYVTLLNERDGGINGVTLVWEECETVYDVPPAAWSATSA